MLDSYSEIAYIFSLNDLEMLHLNFNFNQSISFKNLKSICNQIERLTLSFYY